MRLRHLLPAGLQMSLGRALEAWRHLLVWNESLTTRKLLDDDSGLLDASPLSAAESVFETVVIFSLTCPIACLLLINTSFILEAEFHTCHLSGLE